MDSIDKQIRTSRPQATQGRPSSPSALASASPSDLTESDPTPPQGDIKMTLLRRPNSGAPAVDSLTGEVSGLGRAGGLGDDHDRKARPSPIQPPPDSAEGEGKGGRDEEAAGDVGGGVFDSEVLDEALASGLSNPRDRLLLLRLELQLQAFLAAPQ